MTDTNPQENAAPEQAQPGAEAQMPQQMPQAAVPPMAAATPFQTASLYVGDLHPDVTEALLYDIFNAVGPVASIRVCRDAVMRRSLGYAYVNFHSSADAERALDTMNFTLIKNRPCRIMWSQRDPSLRKNGAGNIFVKHLDPSIDNKALYDTFSLFGNILSCKVVTDSNGKSRGYGFVHFETTEAADEAIKKVNGMMLAEKEVFVGKFLKRNDRPKTRKWTNVYVKNLPKDWRKDEFEAAFAKFGEISSSVVSEDSERNSKGFGFIDFVEHESAKQAIEEMNGYNPITGEKVDIEAYKENQKEENKETGDEKSDTEKPKVENEEGEKDEEPEESPKSLPLIVCRAQKKSERERELARKFEQLKIERQSKYQGVNLYLKNLDDRVDEALLMQEFKKFGEISSAKVMVDETGTSRGFGFVCLSSSDEAIKAVTEMNGKLLMGKPIYVALAQRKDQRRAQLEARHRQQQRMINVPGLGPQGMYPYNNAMQGIGMPGGPQQANAQMRLNQQRQQQLQMMHMMRSKMPQQAAMMQQMQGRQGMHFNANARNTAGMQPQQQAQFAQMQQQMGGQMESEPPLTAESLAAASQGQRKNMIGERLYPAILRLQPQLAAKITGMLLEMDNNELLHLLESPEALQQKVNEAVEVLQRASMRQARR